MIKIILSGTKGGYGYDQFSNNLNSAEISDVIHAINDGRGFVRFEIPRVEYYTLSFSKQYKIFSIYRSCLEVTGATGAYIAITLLISHGQKCTENIRQLLIQLMDIYFKEYVRDRRVQPGLENLGFFTSITDRVSLLHDELWDELDWDYKPQNGTGLVSYRAVEDVDGYFCQPYLHPFDKYAKIAFIDKIIIDNIGNYYGQFYTRINPIDEVVPPESYHFNPYLSDKGIKILRFVRFGKIDGESGSFILDDYTARPFFNKTRVLIELIRPYYQSVVINTTIEEAISDGLIRKDANRQLSIIAEPQSVEFTLQFTPLLDELKGKIEFKYALPKESSLVRELKNATISVRSEQISTSFSLYAKVNNQKEYFKVKEVNALSELLNDGKKSDVIAIDLKAIIYTLHPDSNKEGIVCFYYEGKELATYEFKPSFIGKGSVIFTLYIPKEMIVPSDIFLKLPDNNALQYERIEYVENLKQFIFLKSKPILFEIRVNGLIEDDLKRLQFKLKNNIRDEIVVTYSNDKFIYEVESQYFGKEYTLYIEIDKIHCYNFGKIIFNNNDRFVNIKLQRIPYRLQSNSVPGRVLWCYDGRNIGDKVLTLKNDFVVILPVEYKQKITVVDEKGGIVERIEELNGEKLITIKKREQLVKDRSKEIKDGRNTNNTTVTVGQKDVESKHLDLYEAIIGIELKIKDKPDFAFVTDEQFFCTIGGVAKQSKGSRIELSNVPNDLSQIEICGKIKSIKYNGKIEKTVDGKYLCVLVAEVLDSENEIGFLNSFTKKINYLFPLLYKRIYWILIFIFFVLFSCLGYILYKNYDEDISFWFNHSTKDIKLIHMFEKNKVQDSCVTMNVSGVMLKYIKDKDTVDRYLDKQKADTIIVQIPEKDYEDMKELKIISSVEFCGKNEFANAIIKDTHCFYKSETITIPISRSLTEREIKYNDYLKSKTDSLVGIYKGYCSKLREMNLSYADVKEYKKLFDGEKLKNEVDDINVDIDIFWKLLEVKSEDVMSHINYSISFFESLKKKRNVKWEGGDISLKIFLEKNGVVKLFSSEQQRLFIKIVGDTSKILDELKNVKDENLTFNSVLLKY